jgi:hypothetical protein
VGTGLAMALLGCSSGGGDSAASTAAPPSTTSPTSTTAPATTSTSTEPATEVRDDAPIRYVLKTADGLTVRYTIPAPADNELVQRVEAFHDGVGETRPLRMVLAEVDNQGKEAFEVGDLTVTQGDGDKVHFIEAWLYVGQWQRNIHGQTDSPFYTEGFDLPNDLVEIGIVEPGTSAVTVMAAEDFITSVQSVVARDRTGELVPTERER